MDTAAVVIASIGAAATVVFVLWLFIWAARKDGEDQAARDRRAKDQQAGFHRHWP